MTDKEISEMLDIKDSTVKVTYHIANNKLKEFLS
jgi:DNA-directed RNA polymerase specialized sigma24 family protein